MPMGMHIGLLYWIAISFQTANSGGYLVGGIAIFLLCSFLSIFFALSFYFLFKLNNNYKNIKFGIFLYLFLLYLIGLKVIFFGGFHGLLFLLCGVLVAKVYILSQFLEYGVIA